MIMTDGTTNIERWVMKCPECEKIIALRSMSFREPISASWYTHHWLDWCEFCGYAGEQYGSYILVKKTGDTFVDPGVLVPIREKEQVI